MVDDVRNITETAESKEALDRSRLARERREAEQRKRLDELRAHAAAAQAQREKRDEDRRRRLADQRAKDDDRRLQVEERKRAIWEASISRREALLQRERDRTERLERARAARSSPRPAFAFGSSTPRLLDPLDSAGFFWAARSTNPIDQMNFFESLAASTTNVMFVSAPLTRRASALQLDTSDTDNKDEGERQCAPAVWSSVARRRTDLVPTVPLGRAPECRSGETTPGSRPGSALSNTPTVVRRPNSAHRKPRPASIAGTGVNTPKGGVGPGGDLMSQSVVSTPGVSRDSTLVAGAGDVPRRPATTPRRTRPVSLHIASKPATPTAPGEGKPPLHRKPKPAKEHDKSGRAKSMSQSPGRTLSPTPQVSKDPSVDKEIPKSEQTVEGETTSSAAAEHSQVHAEITQKLEALQVNEQHNEQTIENKEPIEVIQVETKNEPEKAVDVKPSEPVRPVEVSKSVEKKEEREEKKENSQEKSEDNEMTASMTGRRITTEEQAKAALAERRRKAREELERHAELERQRLQKEAEEEAERQRQEEERQRREEEEARELQQLQRQMEEEKLRKAIEAQQQLERDEAERKLREEAEKQARLREDEEKRKAAEEAEKQRKEEAEREEKERLARKQRVEAIMARTRLRKAEEEKKQQEKAQSQQQTVTTAQENNTQSTVLENNTVHSAHENNTLSAVHSVQENNTQSTVHSVQENNTQSVVQSVAVKDNGHVATADLLDFNSAQVEEKKSVQSEPLPIKQIEVTNNGNNTADLLGLSQQNNSEDKIEEQPMQKQNDNSNVNQSEPNNGNAHLPEPVSNVGHISANFLQTERTANENQTKLADDFTSHNGHGALNHPLTLQNAI